jgi:LmbE family N-acetylglucosaminyl deacetylase
MEKKIILAILSGIILLLVLVTYSYSLYPIQTSNYPQGPQINSSDRVLIIAPHPDDEAIATAGVIRYCVENSIPVEVIVMTDGEGYKNLSTQRHNESVKAMKILGLSQDHILFLGYPDGNLNNLLNQNWDYDKPYNVLGNLSNANYPFAYEKNATYCGANLEKNLEEITNNFKPTIIIYPNPEDEQIDHWTTYAFIQYTKTRINYTGREYTYLIHDPPNWPSPRYYVPGDYLLPPNQLSSSEYKWVMFPLNSYQERLKEAAMNNYTSQINSDSYLQSFVKRNELFNIPSDKTVQINNETINFFSETNFPETILTEPGKHDKGRGSVRSRELSSLGFEIDNNNTWISLNTTKNISPTGYYGFHMFTFSSNSTQRLDIQVINGTAYYEKVANDSVTNQLLEVQNRSHEIIIKLPSNVFDGVNYVLISAKLSDDPKKVDWTAWQRIEIIR